MARRKKPLVAGAESGLEALRREIQKTATMPSKPHRERFRELARQVADDMETQDPTHETSS